VALADFIILNKRDLVDSSDLQKVNEAIKTINGTACVEMTEFCKLVGAWLLGHFITMKK
jgi:G3E family GTPase